MRVDSQTAAVEYDSNWHGSTTSRRLWHPLHRSLITRHGDHPHSLCLLITPLLKSGSHIRQQCSTSWLNGRYWVWTVSAAFRASQHPKLRGRSLQGPQMSGRFPYILGPCESAVCVRIEYESNRTYIPLNTFLDGPTVVISIAPIQFMHCTSAGLQITNETKEMYGTTDSSFQSPNTLNNTGVWSLIELASLYTVPLSAVNGLSLLTTTSNGQARPIRKFENSNRLITF